ncbi:MAG: glycosyltransferase family 2 protein [Limosilactobacillus sp.]
MEAKDVDVIIPVYNASKTIKKCIASLQEQNYSSFNIILIDDGSTDNSPAICDYYKKFENTYVYHIKNSGLAYVRNYGLEVATSKYIMFVDSDDWVANNFLEKAVRFMEESHNDIGVFGYYIVSDNDQVKLANKDYFKTKREITKKEAIKGLIEDTIGNFAWNKIYRREIFRDIKYPVGKYFEDLATMYKVFNSAKSIGILNEFLYYYYQRDDSIMHSLSRKAIGDSLTARINLEKYIQINYPDLVALSHSKLVFNSLQYLVYFYREQPSTTDRNYIQASKIIYDSPKMKSLHWRSRIMRLLFKYNKRLFRLVAIKTGKS